MITMLVKMYICICVCLLCIVIYMHMICTKSFTIIALFYNGYIVLNYTAHFVYGPLNSYVYIHWVLDFKYILLLILTDELLASFSLMVFT